jgi:hypothetical protein
VDAHTTLPVGLVAELLPKLRRLRVESVKTSRQGFDVTFVHTPGTKPIHFKVSYAAHPHPQEVAGERLQFLSYEGNGVHVFKFAGHPPFAGTVVKVEGLTFNCQLALK